MAAKLYFIFCTLYNLHKFKMAAPSKQCNRYNHAKFGALAQRVTILLTFGLKRFH